MCQAGRATLLTFNNMKGEAEGLSSSPAVVDKLFFVPDEHQTIEVRFISVLVKAFYRVRGTLSKQLL